MGESAANYIVDKCQMVSIEVLCCLVVWFDVGEVLGRVEIVYAVGL